MAGEPKQIFREKSLERLSTPDRLDQLLRVVKRRMWIPLLALGGLLVLTVVWCFLGRVPITVDATAILVHPRSVAAIQANASGEILTVDIGVGDTVTQGMLIATLHLPDLDKEIELQLDREEQFRLRAIKLRKFNFDSMKEEGALIDRQCALLAERIELIKERATGARTRAETYNEKQRERLVNKRELFDELDAALQERFESYQKLLSSQDTSKDSALHAKQRLYANRLGLADIEVRLHEVELREMEATEAHERQMDLVSDLELRRAQLELRRHEVGRELEEAQIQSETSAEEIQRTILRLKSRRKIQGQILADGDGTVLEVTVSVGSVVDVGQRLASMARADPDEALRALAYFAIGDGKKILQGRPARVSPVTVQQQRYGSIVARVVGFSKLPVTADWVVNQVGNRELAQMLVGDESRIEVELELEADPATFSGFQWTSAGGPDVLITPGTTARVRVTLEERAPITLLIPALRGWLGLD